MEWSPGASFPHFSAMRNGVARRRNVLVQTPVPAAAGDSPSVLRIRLLPLLFVPLSRRLRRASSERTSLAPFPQNRNTAKTPYRSVAPPLQIETVRFDLRRTFRRNLQASSREGTRRAAVGARSIWERSCAVFRRIRTRTPSPTTKGAAAPIGFPGFYGGRGDEGRGTRDCPLRRGRELRIATRDIKE